MKKNKIFISNIKDPYLNLAIENELLIHYTSEFNILFLYENNPCVVMGRFQNPWIECHLSKMKDDGVELVRRQSGGGCVYHDNDNINYSFINSKDSYDKLRNQKVLINSLAKIGVDAFASPRGDLRLNEEKTRKISGCAYKEKKDCAFHHGTMLINSDIDKLNSYIHSGIDHLVSKSIASIRSEVANISEVNSSITKALYLESLASAFDVNSKPEYIEDSSSLALQSLNSDHYKKLKSFNWIYKETPKFFVSENLDGIEIDLEIKKSQILSIEITSDQLHPILISTLVSKLKDKSLFEVNNIFQEFSDEDQLFKLFEWFEAFFSLKSIESD